MPEQAPESTNHDLHAQVKGSRARLVLTACLKLMEVCTDAAPPAEVGGSAHTPPIRSGAISSIAKAQTAADEVRNVPMSACQPLASEAVSMR